MLNVMHCYCIAQWAMPLLTLRHRKIFLVSKNINIKDLQKLKLDALDTLEYSVIAFADL